MFKTGIGFEIFGLTPLIQEKSTLLLCLIAYFYLAMFYDDLKTRANLSYKILRIIMFVYIAYGVVDVLAYLFLIKNFILWEIYMNGVTFMRYLLLFSFIFSFVPYYILLWKKKSVSRYFISANLIFLFCLSVANLYTPIGNKLFVNELALEIGFISQMLIYAVGLAESMNKTLHDKYETQIKFIDQLQINFELQEKVTRELEEKVQERTFEIQQQKEEIIAQSEEITSQRDVLFEQKKHITDSIQYASYIQKSLLDSSEILQNLKIQNFILYKPKDILSGDFYWFKQTNNYLFLAAADCTGHGVPGAFMSILGISVLNEILGKNEIISPASVLNDLRKKIKKTLNQDIEGNTKDGMDITLGLLNLDTLQLQFAGANNPLVLARNAQFTIYETDHMPVGAHPKDNISFKNHEIQLLKDDQFYIFSDGYQSQFGGENSKRLSKKQFMNVLKDTSTHHIDKQADILENRLREWQGSNEQIDDILVIGIKV